MLIEFITEKWEKSNTFLGMGSSNAENNNNNDSYSYLQKNDLTYINYISQAPKGASDIQGMSDAPCTCPALAQHKELETIIKTSRVIFGVIK